MIPFSIHARARTFKMYARKANVIKKKCQKYFITAGGGSGGGGLLLLRCCACNAEMRSQHTRKYPYFWSARACAVSYFTFQCTLYIKHEKSIFITA